MGERIQSTVEMLGGEPAPHTSTIKLSHSDATCRARSSSRSHRQVGVLPIVWENGDTVPKVNKAEMKQCVCDEVANLDRASFESLSTCDLSTGRTELSDETPDETECDAEVTALQRENACAVSNLAKISMSQRVPVKKYKPLAYRRLHDALEGDNDLKGSLLEFSAVLEEQCCEKETELPDSEVREMSSAEGHGGGVFPLFLSNDQGREPPAIPELGELTPRSSDGWFPLDGLEDFLDASASEVSSEKLETEPLDIADEVPVCNFSGCGRPGSQFEARPNLELEDSCRAPCSDKKKCCEASVRSLWASPWNLSVERSLGRWRSRWMILWKLTLTIPGKRAMTRRILTGCSQTVGEIEYMTMSSLFRTV